MHETIVLSGAVDNRQPLIINNRELDNQKEKDIKTFNQYEKNLLSWGSQR